MATEMRTTPEFLKTIRADKINKISHFACFVRSDMAEPIKVSLPFSFKQIEALPKMTAERYRMLHERNHERFSIPTVWEDEPPIRDTVPDDESTEDADDDNNEEEGRVKE